MRRPKLETFIGFVRKYHNARHIGLKMLYRDFLPETDEDRGKLKRAWDVIAKELKNATKEGNVEGDSIAEYQNGDGARQAAETSCSDCPQYSGPEAQEEEETLSKG